MTSRGGDAFVFADTDNGGVIHVANIKGGVGKSTVATNLASALSKRGPTLVIDLDVQGSATHAFGREPEEFSSSSWELFRRRFSPENETSPQAGESWYESLQRSARAAESWLLPGIVGSGDITSLRVRIHPCLDLIPANTLLFNTVRRYHLRNFLFNLDLCRNCYKYVVIDTPSVWNRLTRALYCASDLNLVPVTLNALSTRSLRDYLVSVKNLSLSNAQVRVRIVKNEVFGSQASKVKGKARTMYENRRFLESLCEQVVIRSSGGVSVLPQNMMFDMEIPESSTVRDAQDEGKPVQMFRQYSAVSKAFEKLAERVQYVLNTKVGRDRGHFMGRISPVMSPLAPAAAAVAAIFIFTMNPSVVHRSAPRPVAPQQLAVSSQGFLTHVLKEGESVYRMAKHAICFFRAMVPGPRDISNYVMETVDIHNRTRLPGESRIDNPNRIAVGMEITFYPPSTLQNPWEKQLVPVYQFFTSLVDDSLSYVTGDWCERGVGGGQPHYGIDVAAALGSEIISPIDGTVYNRESRTGGRTLGVVEDNTVLFFSHLHRRFYKTGARVRKGDVIATIGMTGRTSGPHAHVGYGIRVPGSQGVAFGRHHYKVTDPKLFFYRHTFVNNMAQGEGAF